MFTEPFEAFDGTLISNEKDYDLFLKSNNLSVITDSFEENKKQSEQINTRNDREEFEKAKKTVREIIHRKHKNIKRDISKHSDLNFKGIRHIDAITRKIPKIENTRII